MSLIRRIGTRLRNFAYEPLHSFERKIMNQLERLTKEVDESVASNTRLTNAVKDLRSEVITVRDQLTKAIEEQGDNPLFAELADRLDSAQRSATETLDGEATPPADGGETPPTTDTPPADEQPADEQPANPPADEPTGDSGSDAGDNGTGQATR